MIFVTTTGGGSMDRYSQQLAAHLPGVEKLYSDVYQTVAELFNVPWLSRAAARAVAADWRFVRRLRRLQDVVHLPNHHLGRYGNFVRTPYLVTVHDLIRYFDLTRHDPLIHRPNRRDRFYLSLDYRGIRKATKIIAVSEATRRDLVRHLGIPEERIAVVYEGVDHRRFRPVARRVVEAPYLLFVGSEHPRKNLGGLLRAFARLKRDRRFAGLKLVKVGKAGGAEAPFRQRILRAVHDLGLSADVVFAGHVADDDLPAYYSGAACLLLPSFYEGFGLPVLEAMACGCPVVVSDRAALPEIAGEAAVVVDPSDVEGMAGAVRAVLTDEAHRRDLAERGLVRAAGFSWERMADETLRVYRAVEDRRSCA